MSEQHRIPKLPSDPLAALEAITKELDESLATLRATHATMQQTSAVMRQTAVVARSIAERDAETLQATRVARDLMAEIRDCSTAAEEHFRRSIEILGGSPPPQRIPSLPGAPGYRQPAVARPQPIPPLPQQARRVAARALPPAAPVVRRQPRSADEARLDSLLAFPSLGASRRGTA